MPHYLLAVHSDHCETDEQPVDSGPPPTDEDMAAGMAKINALEADMRSAGAFVFTGALTAPDSATVVRSAEGSRLSMTDGPYAEAKEHIAGFYVIEVPDLDSALSWAGRVVECINAPIEVRPFHQGVT